MEKDMKEAREALIAAHRMAESNWEALTETVVRKKAEIKVAELDIARYRGRMEDIEYALSLLDMHLPKKEEIDAEVDKFALELAGHPSAHDPIEAVVTEVPELPARGDDDGEKVGV